jgi:DNA mismatch repair protein MutL
MTDVIRLLPDNIANQIAAGEVVQRPASVVKELLENAIDAGGTYISLIVKEAGKQLIQVIDNGCGMSETDARMSFERHATSKIQNLDDLYQIHTLGFRGEALASIAAVAQVELRTKKKNEEVGTCICIENSAVVKQEPVSCADGSSLSVKNLFYNVPARRNFLRSHKVEMNHIIDEFQRVALANPEITFIFINEGEELYHLKGGNLKQRIVGILGKKYEESLVPVTENTDLLRISGFIGKPEHARKSRGEQFFFANKRFIKNAYLNHAVMTAFDQLLPPESYPFYTIFLELSPSKMDINVHPTKTEIKFEDEKSIYAILRTAVRKSLSQHHIAPSLNFQHEDSIPIIPEQMGGSFERMQLNNLRDDRSTSGFGQQYSAPTKAKQGEWEALYDVLKQQIDTKNEEEEEAEEEGIEIEETRQKPVIQLHNKYIISSIRSGLMIVNQQMAHERILYEKYLDDFDKSSGYSQQLLFPEVIQLQPQDYAVAQEILEDVRCLGFDLEEFGKNTFLLNGVPAEFHGQDQKIILEQIIEDYKNNLVVEKLEKRENLARTMAKYTCLKAGKQLKPEEMTQLIDELFACKSPYFSPGGRPALITISAEEIDKKFR